MFFTKNAGLAKQSKYGRIYVFRFTLDSGEVLHKVGLCYSDRATDRFMEVCRAFFTTYRYIPRCEIRRDKKVLIPRLIEKHLHSLLDDLSYTFDKSFGGSTEFFINLDEDSFLDYLDSFTYSKLLEGEVKMKEVDYNAIKEAIKITATPEPEENDKIPF